MWACVIVCMLLVGTMAHNPSQEEHEPCCISWYFTYRHVKTSTYINEGKLVVEFDSEEGARDAISEQLSVFYDIEYFNGTEVQGRYIADFKKHVLYVIIRHGDDEYCFPSKLNARFPKECVPKDAKFVQEAFLGERDLLVNSWYYSRHITPTHEAHVVQTVGHDGCIPISTVATVVDKVTGESLGVVDEKTLDFNLGICDRDHYFKPPEACEPDRALKQPTPEMEKIMDKQSRRYRY